MKWKNLDPREATQSEIAQWIDLSWKPKDEGPPKDTEALRNLLSRYNKRRFRAMQRDLKWAQKILLQHGVDPEEVRWLL